MRKPTKLNGIGYQPNEGNNFVYQQTWLNGAFCSLCVERILFFFSFYQFYKLQSVTSSANTMSDNHQDVKQTNIHKYFNFQ